MPMDEAVVITRCAQIADDAASELEAALRIRPQSKNPDDLKAAARVQYGIRWCKRIAERIRALTTAPPEQHNGRLTEAVTILREIRPSIAAAHESRWQGEILRRIDAILSGD